MIDLTNKTVDEVNALIQKYAAVLELFVKHHENKIPQFAFVLESSVNYVKQKHNDLTIDWKVWSVFVVKKIFLKNQINSVEDIEKIIDEFIVFWKTEYKKYCNDIIAATEYDRDRGFVYNFLQKKIGSL